MRQESRVERAISLACLIITALCMMTLVYVKCNRAEAHATITFEH